MPVQAVNSINRRNRRILRKPSDSGNQLSLKLEKERDWDLGVDFGTLNWVSTREEDSTAGGLHSCFGKRNMMAKIGN